MVLQKERKLRRKQGMAERELGIFLGITEKMSENGGDVEGDNRHVC